MICSVFIVSTKKNAKFGNYWWYLIVKYIIQDAGKQKFVVGKTKDEVWEVYNI